MMKKKIPKKYKKDIEKLRYLMKSPEKYYYSYLILDIARKLSKRFGKTLGFFIKMEKIEYTR